MKRILGKVVVVLALLSGCSNDILKSGTEPTQGSGGTNNSVPAATPGVAQARPASPTIGTSQDGLAVEVRMRAVGAEQYSSLILVPNRVEAFADGVPVAVSTIWTDVYLNNMGNAEKIATVTVPRTAQKVAFRVELGAAGGFDTATSNGWVDTRGDVLEFERSMADLLRNHNRTVMVIDADKSFVERGDTSAAFVPKYRVY